MWILIAFIIYTDTEFDYVIESYQSQYECKMGSEEVKAHYPTSEIKVYSVCLEA